MREGVTMDYRDIDWHTDRPDLVAIARDWDRTIITPLQSRDPRLSAAVGALEATHVNGGAQLGQFSIDAAPAVRWALSGNRWNEFDLLGRFFRHPAVQASLPAVEKVKASIASFQMEGTLTAFGRFTDWIRTGGAYEKYAGSDDEALQLADEFMRAAFDARLSETNTWVNWMPWTEWFLDVAWDGTFFWFDTRKGIATVLLITDTD